MAEMVHPQEGDQWEHNGKIIEVHRVKDGNVYFGEVGALCWGDWMSMERFLSELERTGAVRVKMEATHG